MILKIGLTKKCSPTSNYSQTWVNDHLQITTTCLQWPLFCGPNFNFHNIKLLLNNDHLSTTATNFWSWGWSLNTGFTVHDTYSGFFSNFEKMNGLAYWSFTFTDLCNACKILFFFAAPGENELPVDLRYTIYCTTIANGKDSDWLFLWNRYRNVANSPSEKKTLLSALSCSTEIWTLQVNCLFVLSWINVTFTIIPTTNLTSRHN